MSAIVDISYQEASLYLFENSFPLYMLNLNLFLVNFVFFVVSFGFIVAELECILGHLCIYLWSCNCEFIDAQLKYIYVSVLHALISTWCSNKMHAVLKASEFGQVRTVNFS